MLGKCTNVKKFIGARINILNIDLVTICRLMKGVVGWEKIT